MYSISDSKYLMSIIDSLMKNSSVHDITYIGSILNDAEHFQNIFYAEKPIGPLRFTPSVPLIPPKGSVIDARTAGACCVMNISEDCLSLRVARSRGVNRNQKVPVVVYLHGGGYCNFPCGLIFNEKNRRPCSASDVLYNPDGLVREAIGVGKAVIYVGVNYRLGFFGFATSKAMVEKKQTNAGLRDQRAALEWVRDNIQDFRGDSNRASDIGLHLTSFNGTQGVPFQQAINPTLVAKNTEVIAQKVNCILPGEDAQSLATLKCLQETSSDILTNLSVTASRSARPPFSEGFFYPTIDGRPSELVRAGKFVHNMPIIASWVTNDGAWYASPSTATDADVLASLELWVPHLSGATRKALLDLYPIMDFVHMVDHSGEGGLISPQYYRAAQMSRDIWFTCPVLDFTWQYSHNNNNNRRAKVWLYEHNATRYSPVFQAMGVSMWRVSHLSDIPYILNNQNLGAGADNSLGHLELSETMSRQSPEEISIQVFNGLKRSNEVVTATKGKQVRERSDIEQAVAWEKLFERCEFINSPQMRQEAGVRKLHL
ncbi:hypothetical protein ASPZODRAFT_155393 [Penicilliopsis zonata CBS 506.65]|uniref:Carboxylesterase type B domain-containing protein n=1 Tax=Penicilliopsis zonata CBS 506.65 TaxID=1073090 RepID=A0A1L9S557_9EURO|nr:hypothetical protein ASPZODRAFT_155393 [Penicilliopsis zonata CBS 506.65]OJJ42290.1 hypothetical protein ASPZODRAFT_155393 [Penicilliopsis zonata CBS 506.65]